MLARNKLSTDLHTFLGSAFTLIVIGLLFIYSSSSVYALQNFGFAHYFVKKQLFGFALGCGVFFLGRYISLQFIQTITPIFFLSSLILTALTLLPNAGILIHGSSRWLNIGFFAFQPSELLKVSLIMYLAHFLAKKEGTRFTFTRSYLPFLIIIGLVSGVLLLQPDFGLTITLLLTSFILFFIADFPLKHLLMTALICLPAVGILIFKYPYRLKRIFTYLNPWEDPQGAGFQIIQSLIAVGSGNWWGSGISHSKQKFFYLPMQHTDFIFSIIAEETGFVGSSIIIFLYLLFLYFGFKIAWQLKKTFCVFTTLGFVLLLSLQALINIFVVTGLLPTKGIGLPFISFGSSGLVCSMAMLGIIANMANNP